MKIPSTIDNRTAEETVSTTADRPSHCGSFPISDPVLHEKGDRYLWNGLYGINDKSLEEIVDLGRSWAFAPDISVTTGGFVSLGFDRSGRCYQLVNGGEKAEKLEFRLDGSKDNPICNPAFFIKNWNGEGASVLIDGKPANDARVGVNRELEGDDLVVLLFLATSEDVDIPIIPE